MGRVHSLCKSYYKLHSNCHSMQGNEFLLSHIRISLGVKGHHNNIASALIHTQVFQEIGDTIVFKKGAHTDLLGLATLYNH